MKKLIGYLSVLATLLCFSYCGGDDDDNSSVLKDGTYRAEEKGFTGNYKGYVVITIVSEKITDVDFDYINSDGTTKKSGDTSYAESMISANFTTVPAEFLPSYEAKLLATQKTTGVDAITGATQSHDLFVKLVDVALNAAKKGNTSTQILQ